MNEPFAGLIHGMAGDVSKSLTVMMSTSLNDGGRKFGQRSDVLRLRVPHVMDIPKLQPKDVQC